MARLLRAATLTLLLAVGGAVAEEAPAFADATPSAAAPVPSRIEVELMVVHANSSHVGIDARLRDIMQHLRILSDPRTSRPYSGFDLLSVHSQNLAATQEATFPVPGDRKAKIQVVGFDGARAKVRVQLYNDSGRFLDTTITVNRNRSFVVAGPKYEEGVLILPITARY